MLRISLLTLMALTPTVEVVATLAVLQDEIPSKTKKTIPQYNFFDPLFLLTFRLFI